MWVIVFNFQTGVSYFPQTWNVGNYEEGVGVGVIITLLTIACWGCWATWQVVAAPPACFSWYCFSASSHRHFSNQMASDRSDINGWAMAERKQIVTIVNNHNDTFIVTQYMIKAIGKFGTSLPQQAYLCLKFPLGQNFIV